MKTLQLGARRRCNPRRATAQCPARLARALRSASPAAAAPAQLPPAQRKCRPRLGAVAVLRYHPTVEKNFRNPLRNGDSPVWRSTPRASTRHLRHSLAQHPARLTTTLLSFSRAATAPKHLPPARLKCRKELEAAAIQWCHRLCREFAREPAPDMQVGEARQDTLKMHRGATRYIQ